MALEAGDRPKRRQVEEIPIWHKMLIDFVELGALWGCSESQAREAYYQLGLPVVKLGPKTLRIPRQLVEEEWIRARLQTFTGGDL